MLSFFTDRVPSLRRPRMPTLAAWAWHAVFLIVATLVAADRTDAEEATAAASARPHVPGVLRLEIRRREVLPEHGSQPVEVRDQWTWNAAETAIIVCDMWSNHRCRASAARVDVLAPKINEVLVAARDRGVAIVHAPSGGVSYYASTPYRRRIQLAPHTKPPVPIVDWRRADPAVEPELPLDATDGGCDDPDSPGLVDYDFRQHAAIRMVGYDVVTDDGQELWNYCQQEGIKNVAILGIHTNMCVLGRSFGIRQLRALGLNVVLCRDLTDAAYDPRDYPYVSHARGTELVIEHIETYLCPSIESANLTRVLPGTAGP